MLEARDHCQASNTSGLDLPVGLPAGAMKPRQGHRTAVTRVVPNVYVTSLGFPRPLADSRRDCGHISLFLQWLSLPVRYLRCRKGLGRVK